jgi:hypothetical protein
MTARRSFGDSQSQLVISAMVRPHPSQSPSAPIRQICRQGLSGVGSATIGLRD